VKRRRILPPTFTAEVKQIEILHHQKVIVPFDFAREVLANLRTIFC
jgi:hypothetical protein